MVSHTKRALQANDFANVSKLKQFLAQHDSEEYSESELSSLQVRIGDLRPIMYEIKARFEKIKSSDDFYLLEEIPPFSHLNFPKLVLLLLNLRRHLPIDSIVDDIYDFFYPKHWAVTNAMNTQGMLSNTPSVGSIVNLGVLYEGGMVCIGQGKVTRVETSLDSLAVAVTDVIQGFESIYNNEEFTVGSVQTWLIKHC